MSDAVSRTFYGFELEPEERIELESTTTKAGLIIAWASLPSIFLIVFVTRYLPKLLRSLFYGTIGSFFGMEPNPLSEAVDLVMLPFKILLFFGFILITIAWIAVCLYLKKRHYGYNLAVTNFRVIGVSDGKRMDAPLTTVINVFLEQPLLGKIFNYGNITVHTKEKSLNFRNIHNPEEIYKKLFSYAEKY